MHTRNLKITRHDSDYEIPRTSEIINNDSIYYLASLKPNSINPDIKDISLPYNCNAINWVRMRSLGVSVNIIREALKSNCVRIKKRYLWEISPTNAGKYYFFTNDEINGDNVDQKISKRLNEKSYFTQGSKEWWPMVYEYIYDDEDFIPRIETVQYINNKGEHCESQEYRFYLKIKDRFREPFLETDQMIQARLSEYKEYGNNFTILSSNNMTSKRSIQELSRLSMEKNILCFCINGMFIELLPPIMGYDYYHTYERGVYINGIEKQELKSKSEEHKKWFKAYNKSSEEEKRFKECWNILLFLNKGTAFISPRKDVLWKYLVDIKPWDTYIRKHKAVYQKPDDTIVKDEVWEINKQRVESNIYHKIKPIEKKYAEIKKIIRLVS